MITFAFLLGFYHIQRLDRILHCSLTVSTPEQEENFDFELMKKWLKKKQRHD